VRPENTVPHLSPTTLTTLTTDEQRLILRVTAILTSLKWTSSRGGQAKKVTTC